MSKIIKSCPLCGKGIEEGRFVDEKYCKDGTEE
nr:MAG TPA: Rad50 zinc hook motif [Caudoviricetes sp.]